jgi:Immunity protein 8
MEAALKGLSSSDIFDVEHYQPKEPDNFGFVLRVLVGPMGRPGEESFDITVCTPKWLAAQHDDSEVILGLHKLIVFAYDYSRLRRFIEKYLMHCSGDTWGEVARKVSLLGHWEFENYRPLG